MRPCSESRRRTIRSLRKDETRADHMRAGRPDELSVQAFPVLTARISETELSKWFPVPFHDLTDPQETPEPSKASLIQLEQGEYFVLYWGELSKQLKLEIPAATDPSNFLDAFFREIPLPRGRILWRRQGDRKSTRLNSSHSQISYAV